MDPTQWNAFKSYLPESLVKDVELDRVIFDGKNLSMGQILNDSTSYTYPDIKRAQTCENKMTGSSLKPSENTELSWAVKWACTAYTLPWMFKYLTKYIHLPNQLFNERMTRLLQEHHFDACRHYNALLDQPKQTLTLSDDSPVAGFYIHTPVRIYQSNARKGKRKGAREISSLPDKKSDLDHFIIRGYMNVYILRHHINDTEHDILVLFRGTSNDFHTPPQFGNNFRNTQVFSCPSWSTSEQKVYEKGSETKPLYTRYYADMAADVKDLIYEHVDRLDSSTARRIMVTGHSMGAGLTILLCDYMKRDRPDLWTKTDFRPIASPLVMNDAAVVQMEQWFIDNKRPYQYMELVNSDDIIHFEYELGGKDHLKVCIQEGIKHVMSWAVFMTQPSVKQHDITDVFKKYPDTAASFFMRGFLKQQTVSRDKRCGFRMGRRADEISFWGHPKLISLYNSTVNLYYCERHINWTTEYVGRSHADYMNMSTNVFWSSLRLWEEILYDMYRAVGLSKRNPLIVLPMFPKPSLKKLCA